ncbi:hypothetical protein C9374_010423 [Naegleria lovaniensis]|uniref:DUF2817 domain-containing protein n=1 Tax=Naegleria lovaniensis TaxID=51637 RepID=A0AA88GG57_NAELO|nr:uncharacterized protein C9374_010423 [Naegleria lovaniensis]KAG2374679.1 hypothetical protein C9374_010423 [Naegleria lovaniensis]
MTKSLFVLALMCSLATCILVGTSTHAAYTFNSVLDHFSSSYLESYLKFKQVCQAASGYAYSEYQLPYLKGVSGEDLFMSVCFQQDKATQLKNAAESNVFITYSGTHGVEGFMGSAVQISLIRNETSRGYILPTNTYALHIHMLNPYGASYFYKENENNVDLLKNINTHYKDFSSWNVSGNVILEQFIDSLNIPQIHLPQVAAQAQNAFMTMIQRYGMNGFTYASVVGQKTRPEGISYTGARDEWTTTTVQSILSTYVKSFSSPNLKRRRIVLVDIHTAVGAFGGIYAMYESNELEFAKMFLHPDSIHLNLFPNPPGHNPGYYLKEYSHLSEATSANVSILSSAWEVGTYPQDQFQNYLISQLNCRFYPNVPTSERPAQVCPYIYQQVREYFYPQSDDWKHWGFGNITEGMRTTLKGMETWRKTDGTNIVNASSSMLLISFQNMMAMFVLVVLTFVMTL